MDEELKKRYTDCVYFLASPLTCKKGMECEYRHSEIARLNPRDCWYWLAGSCLNPTCAFRHPPLESRAETSSEPAPPPNKSAVPVNKTNFPCYFYFNGYCNKGERCSYLRGPDDGTTTWKSSKIASGVPDRLTAEKKTSAGSETGPSAVEKHPDSSETGPMSWFPCISLNQNCSQTAKHRQFYRLLLNHCGDCQIPEIWIINRVPRWYRKMWTKLHEVGSEMIALSKSLSEISRACFRAQVSSSMLENTEEAKEELVAKMEQAETYGVNKRCACQCCGEKADGTDSLACDSCEEIYHVSCVEPIVKDIPLRSWYCAKCTAKGMESPHDNCVVCERLNASRSVIIEDVVEDLTSEDMLLDLEESANGLENEEKLSEGVGDLPHCCNICKTEVRSDEDFRECGHPFCPHKYYHERCLTRKQLDVYGPCWYCPSCLCRACLKDCDDDKIVLCDGCDHAYHIFCMQPPQTSIPSGKWFCKKCNVQIQRIHRAKRTFETLQNELKKKNEQCAGLGVPKGKNEEGLHKSGGVEMLLNAAKTLNYQEESAALGSKDR